MQPSSDCLRGEQFFDHYLVFIFGNICHLHGISLGCHDMFKRTLY